jgi:YVTN family beta-propeller protein
MRLEVCFFFKSSKNVTVIDTAANTIVDTVPAGAAPSWIGLAPNPTP